MAAIIRDENNEPETDFILQDVSQGDYVWLEILDKYELKIKIDDEGICLDLWGKDELEPVATTWAFYADLDYDPEGE